MACPIFSNCAIKAYSNIEANSFQKASAFERDVGRADAQRFAGIVRQGEKIVAEK